MTSIIYRRIWTGMKGGRAGYIMERRTVVALLEEDRRPAPHRRLGMDLEGLRRGWRIESIKCRGDSFGGDTRPFLGFISLPFL